MNLKGFFLSQINKVRRKAGIQAPEEIVKKCLDDEEWLDLVRRNVFSSLKSSHLSLFFFFINTP